MDFQEKNYQNEVEPLENQNSTYEQSQELPISREEILINTSEKSEFVDESKITQNTNSDLKNDTKIRDEITISSPIREINYVAGCDKLTAGDQDVIESAWIDKTNDIIRQTNNNPHARSDGIDAIRQEYIAKRRNN
ncbi:MAG: hypothetical protein Q3996_02810 [Candidatus Saccharibacteria bacterium]|nr:hypothetical protein [Candidatus Saccharibacteria bacterium]